MKKFLSLLGLSLSLSFGAAYAADAPVAAASAPAVAASAPAAKPAVAASGKKMAQQEKMKTCNKDAGEKNLKGADRKTFMKDCLSNKG